MPRPNKAKAQAPNRGGADFVRTAASDIDAGRYRHIHAPAAVIAVLEHGNAPLRRSTQDLPQVLKVLHDVASAAATLGAVSYTHLTLPTIYSV